MSDEVSDEQPQGTPEEKPQGTAGEAQPQGTDAGSDDAAGWKQTAQKWQNRNKRMTEELSTLKSQVKELVDPQEVKSVEGKLSATETELQQAQASAAKYRVALEAGLTPELAKRLVGSTEDELRADAESLQELVAKKPAGATQAQAASGPTTEPNQPTDLNALLRAAAGKGN